MLAHDASPTAIAKAVGVSRQVGYWGAGRSREPRGDVRRGAYSMPIAFASLPTDGGQHTHESGQVSAKSA
jgi:hypothetical protein